MKSDLTDCECAESEARTTLPDLGTKPLSKAVIAETFVSHWGT